MHVRDEGDLYRVGAASFMRRYSGDEDEFRAKICSAPPVVVGEIRFGFAPTRGEVIGLGRMPEQLLRPGGTADIMEGVRLASQRGARVISLGGLTAPATGGGLKLLRNLPSGITITNGNAYTATVVRHNVVEAATDLGQGKTRVAVVGCTGSVGVPASGLLAEAGFDLILIGRTAKRVQHELVDLAPDAVFQGDLNGLRQADIVVLLTNDPAAKLLPHHVSPGTTIIDYAQPANVPPSAYESFRRRNITVVKGGIVRIPKYTCTTDFGLDSQDTFACLAEGYLFAREHIREHSVGRPSIALARRLDRAAERRGLVPVPLSLHTGNNEVTARERRAVPVRAR
jgi:predicted amino acid dehydrogenase